MSSVSPVPGTQSKLAKIASRAATAWIVLAIGCALSAAAAYWVARQVEHEARVKFETDVDDARDAIERRMEAYTQVLHGVRGLFSASEFVSRDAFRRYVLSLDLDRRYPGFQVIGFNRRVPFAQKRDYEMAVRRDTSLDPNGYPDFAIKPPGDRPEYFVVEYFEPKAGNEEAFGLDVGADAVRLASVERARDSGELVASGRVALVRDNIRHIGFTLRLPVYRNGVPLETIAQRREALVGLIGSSSRMDHVMQGAMSEPALRQIRIKIHDAGYADDPAQATVPTAENLLFDSSELPNTDAEKYTASSASATNTRLTQALRLDVGGRRWNLYFSGGPEFIGASNRWLPFIALLGGITISLLLFGLTRSLATTGSRAVKLADRITEDLRKSEASLAEAQRVTQQLIEALPNPIFFKDTDGRYLGVNKGWETFFGVPRQAFIGKTVHDLYPKNPEIAQRLHAMDQVLWSNPGTQVYETSITTPDAQRHDAIYYKATYTRADGSVAGLIGTIVDITERKDLERRFELTFNYAAVGILHTSLDSRMLLANKRFLDMTGYSLEELQNEPTAKIIIPDDVDSDAGLEQQLLEGKIDTYQSEKRYLGKDGRVISTKRTTSIARSADGTPQYYIRVIDDVTETKLNEERYRAMFENAAVGITRVDLNGVLVDVNQKFCDMLGFARDELIGKAIRDITHPDDYGQGAQIRGRVTEGEMKSAIGEKRFVRKNGSMLWALRTMSVVRDDAGNPQYVISIVEDITERRHADDQIRALNKELEQHATQLEASNKELESFSYSVSHDLRSPLRAISGYTRMLEEDHGASLDEEGKRYLSVLHKEAGRMAALIDDLLAFSRLGREQFEAAVIDMTALASEIAEELRPTSVPGTEIQVELLPPGLGDRALLRQVWINLLGNAIKYSSKRDQPRIHVSGTEGQGEASYHIEDNGAGFDMRHYNKLFGVFQRLHRFEEFTGTGIGLAIVHRVVTRHGGRVWAEGEAGRGAVFHFSLPAGENAHE